MFAVKKVLILAYDFPPYNSIGAQRPYSWYKYFKEFGLYPIVVTLHWDNHILNPIDYCKASTQRNIQCETDEYGTIYRVPHTPNMRDRLLIQFGTTRFSLLRKILSAWYMFTEYFFSCFDAKHGIFTQADAVCLQHDISYIIASGEPFLLFSYAHKLSKKHSIPWIADYRDGWSTNYNNTKIETLFFNKIERKIISTASHITTVSPEFVEQFHAISNKQVHLILNGFFEDTPLADIQQDSSQFVISFAGTLYPYQEIELFAHATTLLPQEIQKNIYIQWIGLNFYMDQKQRVFTLFSKNASTYIQHIFTPRIPHEKVFELLQKSSVLLLPTSAKHAQLYAKIFDYLRVQRTILLFPSDNGALSHIITHTQSGMICNNSTEIAQALERLYAEWKSKGFVSCNSHNIAQYSRKEQTKKVVEIITTI